MLERTEGFLGVETEVETEFNFGLVGFRHASVSRSPIQFDGFFKRKFSVPYLRLLPSYDAKDNSNDISVWAGKVSVLLT